MQRSTHDSLIILGGDNFIASTIFNNWSVLKTRYQYYLAQKSKRDNIPWPKLEHDYDSQSRVADLFQHCDNQDTLKLLGMVIKEKLPRVFDSISRSDAGHLFIQIQKTRQMLGPTYLKMFRNASPEDFDRIALAFGLWNSVKRSTTDISANLEAQGHMGVDVDMTHALSIFKDIYRPAYVALAEYIGVPTESEIPNVRSFQQEKQMESNPLAAAISQQVSSKSQNVASFLASEDFKTFRTAICLAMDKTHGWVDLLKMKGLLGGEGMEEFVAKHKFQWEKNRGGEPTMSVLNILVEKDPKFASLDLPAFAELLNSLNISNVQTEVVELTSWLEARASKTREKSQTSYAAQFDMRAWLLKNGVCEETEVDLFLPRLQKEGAKSIESLKGFDKSDLRSCGFNITQANAIIAALKSHRT